MGWDRMGRLNGDGNEREGKVGSMGVEGELRLRDISGFR